MKCKGQFILSCIVIIHLQHTKRNVFRTIWQTQTQHSTCYAGWAWCTGLDQRPQSAQAREVSCISAPVSGKDYSRSMQGWEVDATGNALKNHKRHCRGCVSNASIFNMYFASVLNSAVSCTRICCASRLSRIFHTCTFLNINSWHTRFFPDCLSVLVEPSTPEEAAAVLLCKWGEWGLEDDMSEIHSFQQRRDWDTTRHRKMVTVNAAWSLSCEAT